MAGLVPAIQVVQPHRSFRYGWRPIGQAICAAWKPNHVDGRTSPAKTENVMEISGLSRLFLVGSAPAFGRPPRMKPEEPLCFLPCTVNLAKSTWYRLFLV